MEEKDYYVYGHAMQDGFTLRCPDEGWRASFGSLLEAWQHARAQAQGRAARLTVFSALGNVLFVTSLQHPRLLPVEETPGFEVARRDSVKSKRKEMPR